MKNRKLLNIELGRVTAEQYKELPDSGVCVVLDNIRSAHNVGSVFRSADSFKVDKIWLGGAASAPHLRQQKSTNPHSAPNSASNGSTPLPQWM